jgi:hypothetical protein
VVYSILRDIEMIKDKRTNRVTRVGANRVGIYAGNCAKGNYLKRNSGN